ncbi:MAG: hypothetical protein ACRD21_08835 [Vicinamibacteria bacterium]
MSKWTGWAAMGAGVGVALTSLCCLPFAAALGAGVIALGVTLTPLQPYMAFLSVTLLVVSFVQTIRAPRCKDAESCKALSTPRRWIVLGAITVVTLLLITFPFWSAYLVLWNL